jgi:hypothetical protein
MTDTPDKVVSLFSRKALDPEHVERLAGAAVTVPAAPPVLPEKPALQVDQKSVDILNSALEEVLKGKASGICVFGTGDHGFPRYWISFGKNAYPQAEAVRYIGINKLFEGVLEEIVYNGVITAGETDDIVPDGSA